MTSSNLLIQSKFYFLPITLITLLLPNLVHPWSIFPKKEEHVHHEKSHLQDIEKPIFIAHRGDKFLMPEHTIPAYDLAMLTNVDFVEPDLVMTKDGVLVCHHDITLKEGTDVASHSDLAALMTKNKTLFLDGKNKTILDDWIVADLTLSQLQKLKIDQKSTGWRPHYFDGNFGIPTFQQYLDAVHKDTWRRQNSTQNDTSPVVMGIIPELKHPNFHNYLVFKSEYRMEREFLGVLKQNGYLDNKCHYNKMEIPCSPLVVQCFQVDTIQYLSNITDLTLLTLLDTQNLRYLTYDGMLELQNKTTYLSVWKELLYTGIENETIYNNVTYDKDMIAKLGGLVGPQDFVEYAHSLGFKVGVYTIYHSEENTYRGCAVECEPETTKEEELYYYMDLGVDAFFVEGLSESLRIRDRWIMTRNDEHGGNASGGEGIGRMGICRDSIWIIIAGVVLTTFSSRV